MKISIVLGTRPEIIKMSPVIRLCEQLALDYFVLHTGQHYSYNMDRVFFEQLALTEAKYNLDVGSASHAEQTGKMLIKIEQVLKKEKPDVVLVQGDTNTVLAGALAAAKLGIKVGHVEAGLRSYDREMPEEINRVLADHASDYLFAPTEKSQKILLGEGIPNEKVFVTGNTVVDAVFQNLELSKSGSTVLDELCLTEGDYFLVTVHRQENVDDQTRFRGIIEGLQSVGREFGVKLIYPIHPRAKKQIQAFGIKTEGISLVDPVDYLSFLQLESKAKLIFTDSGGVQEESCILGVPCVTLRDNTERPETLEVKSNVLAGTTPNKILESAKTMIGQKTGWKNPFGDGNSAKRILNFIEAC
ncbi:MAG: non-hydrolyzing UDP-N-acetylglucosamine 2-epimerase [archaeon]